MQLVIREFEKRVEEINSYLVAVEELEETSDLETNEGRSRKYFENDFLKILKSNALLMLYNLVESTIMGGFLEIYGELADNNTTYKMVRREIQDIWLSFRYSEVYDKNAHYNSYKDKASEIVTSILSEDVLELSRKAVNISGNLDAEQIRIVCTEHGIRYSSNPESRGGIVLDDIKKKRNNLAHGTISFVECGRDYSILRLIEIKREAVLFLSAVLDGMKEYYDNQRYLAV